MRTFGVGLAMVLFAVAPASADVFRTHVSGFAVITTFATTSADACVATTGELVAVSTNDGTFGYVAAVRIDSCATDGPVRWDYGWSEPVAFSAQGMTSSSLTGSFAMTPYAGPAGGDVTLSFALTFTGTGAVSTTTSHYVSGSPDDITLSFSSSRLRAATADGSLSVGGDGGGVTSAQLVGGNAGELVVIH